MVQFVFENPAYLWYLLSVPLLILGHYYFLRYAKHRGMKFANFQALKRVRGDKMLTKNHSLLVTRVLILLSLILAAAGTTLLYVGEASETDFVIALDVSASMTAQDMEPNRMEAAKSAAASFIDETSFSGIRTRIGLITFSGSTFIEERPSSDLEKVKQSVLDVDVRREGGTDIAGAVVTGVNLLSGSDKGKTLIIISDGSVTVRSLDDEGMVNALEYAFDEQVIIHTIGIGTHSGPIGYLPEYYNASAVYNEESLLNLANVTSGNYYKVENAEDMRNAYREINLGSEEAVLDVDLSYGLLLVALFLIFLEWGLSSTKFRRLP